MARDARIRLAFCLLMLAGWVFGAQRRARGADPELPAASSLRFVDATAGAGLAFTHGILSQPGTLTQRAAGGVAAGDYDRDGDVDLYVVAGETGQNALFRNDGNGHFENVAAQAGVNLDGVNGSGPLFFDYDGDGVLDLFVGATDGDYPVLFRGLGDGRFEDVTVRTRLDVLPSAVSATAGDYDADGWLDL
jgi:hypothetical protein